MKSMSTIILNKSTSIYYIYIYIYILLHLQESNVTVSVGSDVLYSYAYRLPIKMNVINSLNRFGNIHVLFDYVCSRPQMCKKNALHV